MRYRLLSFAALVSAATVLAACDLGVHYSPREWQPAAGDGWFASTGDISLHTTGISMLMGSDHISSDFQIENHSGMEMFIEAADLMAAGRVFPALMSQGSEEWRTVRAGSRRNVAVMWRFDRPAVDVLQDEATLHLRYRLGHEVGSITIDYTRDP